MTNVTGSNSVNVFLGLGLPWTIAAFYYLAQGKNFCIAAWSPGWYRKRDIYMIPFGSVRASGGYYTLLHYSSFEQALCLARLLFCNNSLSLLLHESTSSSWN